MKLHLPKLLLTAVVCCGTSSYGAVTNESFTSATINGVTPTAGQTITILKCDGQNDLTANQAGTSDYIVLSKNETSNANGRYKVKSDVFVDTETKKSVVVIGDGSYTNADGTTTSYYGGQLFVEAWQTSGVKIDNDIIIGESKYKEGDGAVLGQYGGALRLHEADPNRKIVLAGNITLLSDAQFSIGGSTSKLNNYLEGYLNAEGKTLTLSAYNSHNAGITFAGGANIGTLTGNAPVAFSATKSDGTGATSTSYTIGNLTTSAAVSIDANVSVTVTQSASGAVTNNGSLSFVGATITGAVTNNGTMSLSDSNIGQTITNNGTMSLSDSAINNTITNSGTITLSGTVAIGGTNGNADITLLEEITQGTETGAFSHGDNGWKTRSGGSYYLIKGSGENAVVTLNDGVAFSNGTLDASEKGSLKVTGIGSAYDRNTTYYANTGTSNLRTADAPDFVVAKGAELVFSDAMPTGNKTLNVTGEGKLKVTMQNGTTHGSSISLGEGFTGTLSIAGGKMELTNFRYNEKVVLELISGQNWDNVTINNEVLLSAAGIDSAYDFAYSNIDINGKVTGNYLRVTDPERKGGYLKLTNSANDIEQVKVTGRNFYFEAGKLGTLTATGGTSYISGGEVGTVNISGGTANVSGGSLGNLISTGGTTNITGTVSIGGGAKFATSHDSGLYLKENGTVNIGDGTSTNTVTFTRVEMGDNGSGNGGVLNVKNNATLVVTAENTTSYHTTGFVIGEWSATSTLNVDGTVLAENATLFVGDGTANVVVNNGGTVAVKGIGITEVKTEPKFIQAMNLTLNDGGKIVLGDAGINTTKPFSGVLGAGTIGISADAAINTALALKSSTGTTFDTQKYVWGEGGASIAQGTEGGTLSISGVISDHSVTTTEGEGDSATTTTTNYPGKLVKAGVGTLELSGANTYSGGTTVQAGTLLVKTSAALGSGAVEVQNGATLDVDIAASGSISGEVTLKSGSTMIVRNGYTNVNTPPELTAAIKLDGDATLESGWGGDVGKISGTLNGQGTLSLLQPTWREAYSENTWELASALSDKSDTEKMALNSNANVTISNANSYSGGTTITGRTLTAANESALGTGKVTMNGGTLAQSAALSVSSMEYNGGTVDQGNHALTVTGKLDVKNNMTIGHAANEEAGTAASTGAISIGSLDLAADTTLTTYGNLEVAEGGTIKFGNGSTMSVNGSLTLDASAVQLGFNIGDLTYVTNVQLATATGGINLTGSWSGAGEYVIAGEKYVAELAAVENVLSLTFDKVQPDSPSITTVETKVIGVAENAYDSATKMLTLKVDALLTENSKVLVDLMGDPSVDSCMQEVLKQVGDMSAMVYITLEGTDGSTLVADTLDKVVFVKGTTGQNYWGEMVGGKLMYNVNRIPEPASATLSLAALMMLCARRRRK